MPPAVISEMRSVTMDAVPPLMARKRSASGMRHSRWSQGSYEGVRCGSMAKSAGNRSTAAFRRIAFIVSGLRRESR